MGSCSEIHLFEAKDSRMMKKIRGFFRPALKRIHRQIPPSLRSRAQSLCWIGNTPRENELKNSIRVSSFQEMKIHFGNQVNPFSKRKAFFSVTSA
jgi:hypothetical protein